MKETPQDKALEERLAASKFSAQGFLGADTRTVDQIVADDLRTLERLALPLPTLHAALADAFAKARNALGAEIQIRPGLVAVAHESMGRIPSPFQGDGVFEKGDVVLSGPDGAQLVLSALGLSMIEKHAFFQGHGSRYRIDPLLAARLLGLAP